MPSQVYFEIVSVFIGDETILLRIGISISANKRRMRTLFQYESGDDYILRIFKLIVLII